MTRFLTFTVYAPLASWGEVAVGEVRESLDRPTRSAMLGLIAAGLGLDRTDDAGHLELHDGYGSAVLVLSTGRSMRDYHTAQTATAAYVRRRQPATRRDVLQADGNDLKTVLSQRTLRQDHLAVVALWRRPSARWTLEELAGALHRPSFTPYAGRRANALALPLGPVIHDCASLGVALEGARAQLRERLTLVLPGLAFGAGSWTGDVFHDDLSADGIAGGSMSPRHRVSQRDAVVSRSRWQFGERTVFISHLPESLP